MQADKGKIYFIQLNDGSIPLDIQALVGLLLILVYATSLQPNVLQVVIDSTAKGFDSGGLNMPGSQVARCESQLCQGLKGKVGTGASLKCTGKVRQKMSGTWIFFSSSFCP